MKPLPLWATVLITAVYNALMSCVTLGAVAQGSKAAIGILIACQVLGTVGALFGMSLGQQKPALELPRSGTDLLK